MPQRTVTVAAAQGLHARPAKIFVEAAARQPVKVLIGVPGRPPVLAASLLAVLTLGAAHGTEVTLQADGDDGQAERALDELAALLARDLDAEDPEPT
ncbi:Phosphocarrier protein HPr [Thermomonospora echinospora]|uniref:Phosphocarrier protein HPr n=1 Tax=Thermomonospora echinospora TaxID=1992 RepID=A0A1H6E2K7_9ACTN|nr:HPr family phosphocarrier protein [Thermomonospora echinospora]SEG91216.1 Phosphocarrier protein HPr [Thermomonospora echinospora]